MSLLKEVIRDLRKPVAEGKGIKVFPLKENRVSGMDFGREVLEVLRSAGLIEKVVNNIEPEFNTDKYDLSPQYMRRERERAKNIRVQVSGAQSRNIRNINVQLFDSEITDIEAATKLLNRTFGHVKAVRNTSRPQTGPHYGTGRQLPVVRIQFDKAVMDDIEYVGEAHNVMASKEDMERGKAVRGMKANKAIRGRDSVGKKGHFMVRKGKDGWYVRKHIGLGTEDVSGPHKSEAEAKKHLPVNEAHNADKTEHSGAKKGKGAYYGRKKDAKRESNKKRRRNDKHAMNEGWGWEDVWEDIRDDLGVQDLYMHLLKWAKRGTPLAELSANIDELADERGVDLDDEEKTILLKVVEKALQSHKKKWRGNERGEDAHDAIVSAVKESAELAKYDRIIDKITDNLQYVGEYSAEDLFDIYGEELATHFDMKNLSDKEHDFFNDLVNYAMDKYTKDTGHHPE